jgi:hypothetical protein
MYAVLKAENFKEKETNNEDRQGWLPQDHNKAYSARSSFFNHKNDAN